MQVLEIYVFMYTSIYIEAITPEIWSMLFQTTWESYYLLK